MQFWCKTIWFLTRHETQDSFGRFMLPLKVFGFVAKKTMSISRAKGWTFSLWRLTARQKWMLQVSLPGLCINCVMACQKVKYKYMNQPCQPTDSISVFVFRIPIISANSILETPSILDSTPPWKSIKIKTASLLWISCRRLCAKRRDAWFFQCTCSRSLKGWGPPGTSNPNGI